MVVKCIEMIDKGLGIKSISIYLFGACSCYSIPYLSRYIQTVADDALNFFPLAYSCLLPWGLPL